MIFKDDNRTYDTSSITESDEKYFKRLMQYKYNEIENIVNPRRCVDLTPEVISNRVALAIERISTMVCLTEEQVTFVLDYKNNESNKE